MFPPCAWDASRLYGRIGGPSTRGDGLLEGLEVGHHLPDLGHFRGVVVAEHTLPVVTGCGELRVVGSWEAGVRAPSPDITAHRRNGVQEIVDGAGTFPIDLALDAFLHFRQFGGEGSRHCGRALRARTALAAVAAAATASR